MRAIDAQELPAFRDNRNRWQISPEALGTWAGAQWAPTGQHPPDAQPCPLDAHPSAQGAKDDIARDLAAARLTIVQLEARLAERAALVGAAESRAQSAEEERDRWRVHAEKLTELLAAREASTPVLASPSAPRHRAWRWPWRRS